MINNIIIDIEQKEGKWAEPREGKTKQNKKGNGNAQIRHCSDGLGFAEAWDHLWKTSDGMNLLVAYFQRHTVHPEVHIAHL